MFESGRPDSMRPADARREASLGDFFGIIVRRWLTVALVTAMCLALAIGYIAISPTKYTSSTSILLSSGNRPLLRPDTGMPTEVPDATLIESQLKIITSSTILGRVVDQQHLVDDPEFVPTSPGLRDRLFAMIGLGGQKEPTQDRRLRAIIALGQAVSVRRSERTYVLDLDVTSKEPAKATRLADAIAQAFLDDQKAARESHSDATADYLTTRVAELQTRLLDAEAKVEAYKEANGIQGANGKLVNEEQLAAINNELAKAKLRTADARAAYDQVQDLLRSGRLPDATGDALKSPTIERLRAQYAEIVRQEATYRASLGARHPNYIEVQSQLRETRRLIGDELKRLSVSAYNQYQLARASEAQVAKQFEDISRSSTTTSQALVRLRELQRRVDAAQADYDRALRSRESVREAGAELPSARIIATANMPLAPSAPKRLPILALALACGLSFGIGAAALREHIGQGTRPGAPLQPRRGRRARKVRDPAPVLTATPATMPMPLRAAFAAPAWQSAAMQAAATPLGGALDARAAAEPGAAELGPTAPRLHAVADDPQSPYAAAIRRLYEVLRDAPGARADGKVVFITSTHAGAGKTTIAANLACIACERGARTLLIDANPHNPTLAQAIATDTISTPIELAGTARQSWTVDAGGGHTYRVLPMSGDETLGPSMVPEAASAAAPIRGIKGNFDFVVIDGPSSDDGVTDDGVAGILQALADHVIVVAPRGPQPASLKSFLRVPAWELHTTAKPGGKATRDVA